MNKGKTGFRLMGRYAHTSIVWVVGTFRERADSEGTIKKVLLPMTGNEIIYRTEAF